MRCLLAVICTFFSIQTFANGYRDSIGVENNDGNQLIIHKVAPKESYYSIGRLYKVPPKDIINFNKNVSLQIGTILKVPTSRPFVAPAAATKTQSSTEKLAEDFTLYKVGPKETLFSISRRFSTSVEEIKKLNDLKSNNLTIGQLIKVRRIAAPEPEVQHTSVMANPVDSNNPPSEAEDSSAEEKYKIPTGRLGVTERSERGVAVWIADENLDGTKMLALHRTAPVGTVIKITNPMTDRTTFAKVVGKFTENETTKDVIIVITKATADLLGALDKRFLVNIDYGMPNNE